MERIKWIDFGKGFTIFFVLVGHCISNMYVSHDFTEYDILSKALMTVIFTFIMPCFFALSGFLYNKSDNVKKYISKNIKRAKGLIIPYILFSIVYIFLQQFAKADVNKLYSWRNLTQIWYRPMAYLWFIYILFLVFLIVGLLDLLKVNLFFQGIIYLLLFIVVQMLNLPYLIVQTTSWIICFFVGIIIRQSIKIIKSKLILVISIILMLAGIYFQYFIAGRWFNPNEMSFLTFISKVASIFVFFYIFSNIKQKNLFNYFEKFGPYSMVIYLVHVPIKTLVKVILFKIGISNYFIFLILLVLLTWELSVFVCYLTRKFKLIDFAFFPTKYF